MKKIKIAFLLFSTFLCFPSLVLGDGEKDASLIMGTEGNAVFGRNVYWYRGEETFQEVLADEIQRKFVRGTSDFLNFGDDKSQFWFRVTLENQSSQKKDYPTCESRRYIPNTIYVEKEKFAEWAKTLIPTIQKISIS